MDYADDAYDIEFIEDLKGILKVLVLFILLPIFWALFDQQGSSWTFQASRMNGEIGESYSLKPDQFQIFNPILILLLIPTFQYAIYPVIAKFFFINTPLRKMTVGGLLAAVAFLLSGLVELKLEV